MLEDNDFYDSLLAEMSEISSFLAEFAGEASILLKNDDEDGFTDLVMRASVDVYDYGHGKMLKKAKEGTEKMYDGGWTVI